MKRIDTSFDLAVVLVLVNNLIRSVFIEYSIMPAVGHQRVADGNFFDFINPLRTAYFDRQMEWLTHRTAIPLRLYIYVGGSNAEPVPSIIGKFDRIKGERFTQNNICPTVTIEI